MMTRVRMIWGVLLTAAVFLGGVGAVWGEETAAGQNPAPNTAVPAANTQSVSAVAETLSPETQQRFQEAVNKFNQSDIAGALETLNLIAASDPRVIPPRLILAQWFAQAKNHNAVRVSLEMATEESPTDPEAFVLLGEIALRQGEFTAAELLLQKAETVLNAYQSNEPRQKILAIKLNKNKVALAQARKRWDKMQEGLGALLKLEGKTAENCRLIAMSFFYLNKEQAARDWFLSADQLDPGKGLPADAQMARLYMATGDAAKAKESLKNALAANPNSVETLNLSLSAAINDNDPQTAAATAAQLYAADAKNPETLKNCGIAALYREDFAQAEKLFREGLELAPADTEIANGLALALCEQNDPEKIKLAAQYAASNLQKQGNNREFLSTLGWVLYKSGSVDKALQTLQQSAADGQMNSAAAYYLAVLLNEKGEKQNAQKLLAAAVTNPAPFFKRKAANALLEELK